MRIFILPFHVSLGLVLAALCLTAGCQADSDEAPPGDAAAQSPRLYPEGVEPMTIEVTSPAFAQGEPIPRQYTEDGDDLSPPIHWSDVPEQTRELVLICDDPDAPTPQPWVHWVAYKIPAGAQALPEGVSAGKTHPKQVKGMVQGSNSWLGGQTIGYRGPAPPRGPSHRYYFKVYALDVLLTIEPGVAKQRVLEEIAGHVIAQGELMGTYGRK